MLGLSLAANPFSAKPEKAARGADGGKSRDREQFVRRPRSRISHEWMVLGSADIAVSLGHVAEGVAKASRTRQSDMLDRYGSA
jgi:hypothetical protein